jgi:hypothetical protein
MFVVHGPVKPDSPAFVARPEVLATIAGWLDRGGCVGVVMGARQTGKTTMCFALRAALAPHARFAYVDFQGFQGGTWNECAAYIGEALASQLGDAGDKAMPVPDRGAALPGFLASLAARVAAVRITILFEELGWLPEDCRRRLGQLIRSLFTSRLTEPAYERYAFVILGAHELRTVAGTRNSPLWNVAEKLYLSDFTRDQVAALLGAVTSLRGAPARRAGDFLYHWTSGHPYWSQRLAAELAARCLPRDPELADLSAADQVVADLVKREDTNLPHLIELLDSEGDRLWTTIARVLDGPVPFTRFDRDIAVLELLGAIVDDDGWCRVRNRIYEQVIARRLDRAAPMAGPIGARDPTFPSPTEGARMSNNATPTVFLSYTHDSAEHRRRVLDLAQRLREDGVDCTIDQFVNGSPSEGWPLWMERQIARAGFVLVACTATYLRRYQGEEEPGKGLGATWEAVLTRQELYEMAATNTKFVPILLEGASPADVPSPLRAHTWHHLPSGYEGLLRYLTGQPAVVPRPLGAKKTLPPGE